MAAVFARLLKVTGVTVNSTVKNSYTREDYLLKCSRVNRSVIAKLRMGIFPLQVERGRYRNIPHYERLCESCEAKEVEDLDHFLLNCEKHSNLRAQLYDTVRQCKVKY